MTDDGEGRSPSWDAGAGNGVGESGEREAFERSMRDFAEGATALAAASLRLQMMMLEQMREMAGDFSDALGEAMARESKDD